MQDQMGTLITVLITSDGPYSLHRFSARFLGMGFAAGACPSGIHITIIIMNCSEVLSSCLDHRLNRAGSRTSWSGLRFVGLQLTIKGQG